MHHFMLSESLSDIKNWLCKPIKAKLDAFEKRILTSKEERRVSRLSPPEVFLNVCVGHLYAWKKAEDGHSGRGERNINN